ncbi:MAG: hypothetical protein JXO22_06620, partial [Phycisphaerae bacterium]|nr:hypothetical protein [Phycisphaerae bacterium]
MAERGGRIETVTIDFIQLGREVAGDEFDCWIQAGADVQWTPRVPDARHVNLAVLESAESGFDAQATGLLRILGAMKQERGLSLAHVKLNPDSDVRYHPDLPEQAHALRDLLVR